MSTAEEMEAGRRQSEYWANPGARRPQLKSSLAGEGRGVAPRKNDGTTNVVAFGPTGKMGVQGGAGAGRARPETLG